jgi:hypothetical protein
LRPRKPHPTLGDLIQPSGLTAADVAFLANLQESTVSRYWSDPDWSDKISGKGLKALMAVIPGLGEHLQRSAIDQRLQQLTVELDTHGLTVNPTALNDAITSGTAVEHLTSALQAAARIMDGDSRAVTGHLARVFGRDQDQALGHLFHGLIVNPTPLLDAATGIADQLRSKRSAHAFMSVATIQHHTARATGNPDYGDYTCNTNQRAFMHRSTCIGLILATDDHDLVDRYADDIAHSTVATRIELWAMASYNRDIRPTGNFWLPKGVILTRTADEVLRELGAYNTAYSHYLARIFLPAALELDPTFGGRRHALATALLDRRAQIDDNQTSAHIARLLERIT